MKNKRIVARHKQVKLNKKRVERNKRRKNLNQINLKEAISKRVKKKNEKLQSNKYNAKTG
tara:strand:+ start:728 stop:907 length:180 start_codon:yes stop_codon:yes gene_type:complete